MYPKYNFDDSLETIEKIGKKREIHNYMTRFRMDMLDPIVTEEVEEPAHDEMMGPVDEFDELLDQQIASSTMPSSTMGRNKTFVGNSQLNVSGISSVKEPEEPTPTPSPPVVLTEEMRRKIAENRLKAMERLKARQNPPPVPVSQEIASEPMVSD
jgi:TIMELESS-interacting protein